MPTPQPKKGLTFELSDLYKPDPAFDYQPTPEAPPDAEAVNHPVHTLPQIGYNNLIPKPEEENS